MAGKDRHVFRAVLVITVFCCCVYADNHITKSQIVDYVKSRINSASGKRCTSIKFTEDFSDGYNGFIEWEDGAKTALTVKVQGRDIQYSFGKAIQPQTNVRDFSSKPYSSQKRSASERGGTMDSPQSTSPSYSEKASDTLILICIIGGIILIGGIAAAIIAFVKGTKAKYDYNIFDWDNLGMTGGSIGILAIIIFLVAVFNENGNQLGTYLTLILGGLTSIGLLTGVFIRTIQETSLIRAIIAFPLQLIFGPLILLFLILTAIAMLNSLCRLLDKWDRSA